MEYAVELHSVEFCWRQLLLVFLCGRLQLILNVSYDRLVQRHTTLVIMS